MARSSAARAAWDFFAGELLSLQLAHSHPAWSDGHEHSDGPPVRAVHLVHLVQFAGLAASYRSGNRDTVRSSTRNVMSRSVAFRVAGFSEWRKHGSRRERPQEIASCYRGAPLLSRAIASRASFTAGCSSGSALDHALATNA